MEKTNVLYGVGGLLVGIIIAGCFWSMGFRNNDGYSSKEMMHQMPDGRMMNNMGTDMNDNMQNMMSGLEGKTGDAFDKEFISEMIVHHQGAVDMAHAVLKTSKRPELIKLANDIISAQTKEIGMMQEWQKTWFIQ